MRLSIAINVLSATSGLALSIAPQNNGNGAVLPKARDQVHTQSHAHGVNSPGYLPPPQWLDDKSPHPSYHENDKGYKHPGNGYHFQDKVLTDTLVTDKLNQLAKRADDIAAYVTTFKQCGVDNHCWENVKNALYELEFELDAFDTTIDKSSLDKCFTCTQESRIACAYKTYGDSMIHMLDLIRYKTNDLPGEIDKYVLTAINSLRGADSTFVHELGRRLYCEDSLKAIMAKHGAVGGSTKGSINAAFSNFIFTPLITGEHFKSMDPIHRRAH